MMGKKSSKTCVQVKTLFNPSSLNLIERNGLAFSPEISAEECFSSLSLSLSLRFSHEWILKRCTLFELRDTVKKYHSRVDTLSHVRFSPNDGVNIRSHRFEAPYVQLLPSL